MANIKQIKLSGTAYDINPKYIQDSSGNAKTWKDIQDSIQAAIGDAIADTY